MPSASLEQRIDQMHSRDRIGALAFVVALWVVFLFILIRMWSAITVGPIHALLVIFGALVLLFNTAGIVAMLRHYRDDKHFIYGLDLRHLDEMRRRNQS
jgi:succinate-acetate transporter protein